MVMHVVHVEDEKPLRGILAVAFRAALPDINLQQFRSGDDAVNHIRARGGTVDLFLIDIRLPGRLDGLALAQHIRQLACPGYVVLTSAYGSPAPAWLKAWQCTYVPKPWHIAELTQSLLQFRLKAKPSCSPADVTGQSRETTVSSPIDATLAPPPDGDGRLTCPTCQHQRDPKQAVCTHCGTSFGAENQRFATVSLGPLAHSQAKAWSKGSITLGDHDPVVVQIERCRVPLPLTETLMLGYQPPMEAGIQTVDLAFFGARQHGVSHRHLKLIREHSMLYVVDLGSTNGTRLNGRRLVPNSRYILRDGDELHLGKLPVKVQFHRPEPAPIEAPVS